MDKKNILDRLSDCLDCSNDTELTKVLDVPKTTLSYWRSKSSIPIDKLTDIATKFDLSLDYLVLGKQSGAKQAIDTSLLAEIAFEFEIVHKAVIEKIGVAQWMWFYDSMPEEAEKESRPTDEQISEVLQSINSRAELATIIGGIYNNVKDESNKQERVKAIRQLATITSLYQENPDARKKSSDYFDKLELIEQSKKSGNHTEYMNLLEKFGINEALFEHDIQALKTTKK